MPLHSSFAAQLAVSPPIHSPGGFVTTAETWAIGLGDSYIDTLEKRQAIVDDLMHVYDATGLAVGKSNSIAGALFPLLKNSVASMLMMGLVALHSLATPTIPAVTVDPPAPVVPTGSAAPQ